MTVSKAHLLVIDPSLHAGEAQGVSQILTDWPGTSKIVRPALVSAERVSPEDGYDGVDGVVLMGSAASVNDQIDWLDALNAWLAPVLSGEVEVPLLGICFGHQLIAKLEGGSVGFVNQDQSKRVGVEVSQLSPSRLMSEESRLRVIVSHRELVETPPPERYRAFARRPGVSFDGLEHETLPIFSVQFHPEARDEFASRVGIALDGVDARLHEDGQRFLGAFRDLVKRRVNAGD